MTPLSTHRGQRWRRALRCEPLETRNLLAALWRNPVDSLDVDGDGSLSALDALPIVWDEPAVATSSSAKIADFLKEGLTVAETNGERKQGDALSGERRTERGIGEQAVDTEFHRHAAPGAASVSAKQSG
mgnify:CR=1 FL=1